MTIFATIGKRPQKPGDSILSRGNPRSPEPGKGAAKGAGKDRSGLFSVRLLIDIGGWLGGRLCDFWFRDFRFCLNLRLTRLAIRGTGGRGRDRLFCLGLCLSLRLRLCLTFGQAEGAFPAAFCGRRAECETVGRRAGRWIAAPQPQWNSTPRKRSALLSSPLLGAATSEDQRKRRGDHSWNRRNPARQASGTSAFMLAWPRAITRRSAARAVGPAATSTGCSDSRLEIRMCWWRFHNYRAAIFFGIRVLMGEAGGREIEPGQIAKLRSTRGEFNRRFLPERDRRFGRLWDKQDVHRFAGSRQPGFASRI